MISPWCARKYLVLAILFNGIPIHARPVTVMPEDRLALFQKLFPPVGDAALNDILSSDDTIWYDKYSMIPGYQDSFGDNVTFPVGMRPNTIESSLIDLAVPGGHAQLFLNKGTFHFPFGRTGGLSSAQNTFVIDFWRLPSSGGKLLPVAYSNWNPNNWTRRVEWMFPVGTVFGEVLFIIDGQDWYVFEIRTRTRYLTGWDVDVFRPFRTALEFAQALERKRKQKPEWQTSAEIDTLIAHLRKNDSMTKGTLKTTHYAGAFPQVDGGVDTIPGLSDNTILKELMQTSIFESAKGQVWKDDGVKRTFAASTSADFSIVPKNYDAAFFEVSETFCNRCHMDAGRPFKDYYKNVVAYGELWGEDDVFSWHPFDASNFVDANGKVKNFNYDNRKFRQDFVNAGILEKYDSKKHAATFYKRLDRTWKNYKH